MFQSFNLTRKLQINNESTLYCETPRAIFRSERNIIVPSLFQKLKLKPIQDFQVQTQTNNNSIKSSLKNSNLFTQRDQEDLLNKQRLRHNKKQVSFSDKLLIIQPNKGVIIRERIPELSEQVKVIRTRKRKNCILIHSQIRTLQTCQSTFIDQL
ncbi:unnamed protein product (macronuclear) [Paramecium tetraurelia]|uniref:Uncharacterized protein n=1 Tax=Paramecium tetraurelia TaxID=5888 RepID=A0BTH2_PARTE|nr:uncharacterized protein GSPATT00032071001 [Paramecium tetraurelia]CAK61839.1 unnamed protein product [Paramecium tetraurelia]|eukprot:XP_001429237.1 hypothetical protein (macronuclear) [Paramecium tetraurelia strain d4-2]